MAFSLTTNDTLQEESSVIDDMLEASERIYHRAIARHQVAMHERFMEWDRQARATIKKLRFMGHDTVRIKADYRRERARIKLLAHLSTKTRMDDEEIKQADRDFAILLHFRDSGCV